MMAITTTMIRGLLTWVRDPIGARAATLLRALEDHLPVDHRAGGAVVIPLPRALRGVVARVTPHRDLVAALRGVLTREVETLVVGALQAGLTGARALIAHVDRRKVPEGAGGEGGGRSGGQCECAQEQEGRRQLAAGGTHRGHVHTGFISGTSSFRRCYRSS
jgi:hypothetical protein